MPLDDRERRQLGRMLARERAAGDAAGFARAVETWGQFTAVFKAVSDSIPKPPSSPTNLPLVPRSSHSGDTHDVASLHAHLDANPDDHHARALLADSLEDSGQPHLQALAPGYRRSAELKRTPHLNDYGAWVTQTVHPDWDRFPYAVNSSGKTRRDAEDAAALDHYRNEYVATGDDPYHLADDGTGDKSTGHIPKWYLFRLRQANLRGQDAGRYYYNSPNGQAFLNSFRVLNQKLPVTERESLNEHRKAAELQRKAAEHETRQSNDRDSWGHTMTARLHDAVADLLARRLGEPVFAKAKRSSLPPTVATAMALAMVEEMIEARKKGHDGRHESDAAAELLDADDDQLQELLASLPAGTWTGTKGMRAAGSAVLLKAGKWSEDVHPRGTNGRFISKDRLNAAKDDPKLARQLRKEVRPEDQDKLSRILTGEADPGKTKKGERRAGAADRRASKANASDVARKATVRFVAGSATADDVKALADALPHLTVDRLRQVRAHLAASFGGARQKADLVAALRSHIADRAEQLRTGGTADTRPERDGLPGNWKDKPPPEKKKRAGKPKSDSLVDIVKHFGGINPTDPDFLANYTGIKEAIEYGLPLGVFKKGGENLSNLATQLHDAGHISHWGNTHEGEHLLNLLRDKVKDGAADATAEYDAALDAHYKEMQDAHDADPARRSAVEAAVRDGEAAGRSRAQESDVDEGGRGDGQPEAEGPDGVDDSFAFGANDTNSFDTAGAGGRVSRETDPGDNAVTTSRRGLDGVWDELEGATGKGRMGLETALGNAGYDTEGGRPDGAGANLRDVVETLASSHLDAHDLGWPHADRETIARALHHAGADPIHAVGDTVPFDNKFHESTHPVSTGEPVRVTRQGWAVNDATDANGQPRRYVLERAQVGPTEPAKKVVSPSGKYATDVEPDQTSHRHGERWVREVADHHFELSAEDRKPFIDRIITAQKDGSSPAERETVVNGAITDGKRLLQQRRDEKRERDRQSRDREADKRAQLIGEQARAGGGSGLAGLQNAKTAERIADDTLAGKPTGDPTEKVSNYSSGEVVGSGNTGEVRKDGNDVVKNIIRPDGTKTKEGQVYADIKGVVGVAPGRLDGNTVRLPHYQEVLSTDTVPDARAREGMGGVIADNTTRLLNAINGLSESGYDYNDPIQVGFDDDYKSHLLDFSNAGKVDRSVALRANLERLARFMEDFGAKKQADQIMTGFGVYNYARGLSGVGLESINSRVNKQVEMGRKTAEYVKSMGLDRLHGYNVNHVYYSTNPRPIERDGILQSDHINGIRVMLSDKPLDPDTIRMYGMVPVVHPAQKQ